MQESILEQPIHNSGTYLTVNESGYLEPESNLGKLQEDWKPAIEDFIQGFKEAYGDNLHSIYIRGSVAKGAAISGIADLDAFIITNNEVPLEEKKQVNALLRDQLTQKYPFVTKFEMPTLTTEKILSGRDRVLIKLQSFCVYGEDLRGQIPDLQPGPETFIHLPSITREWLDKELAELLEEDRNKDYYKNWCTWLMKRLLRAAHELVAERSQQYTRDLYRCWEGFSTYYPEQKEVMYQALKLAIYPINNPQEIHNIAKPLGDWLITEITEQYPNLN